ncbi:phosphotransferase family protein [Lacticaseibacillus camelliae]|uniref:Aminoglycoside phosphotransferase domain-containing protein n=1 Tax=Lacticaseibacillus camelliae DSM 22697 = JCM 13995 TaxID=1423730 RepID=A0A0R2EXR3_9LACO|nr:aminoglycoside phosphotransferase family protein [Lacticaseibacillus camelliae]KRN18741.1 hypothetical protein FC75_GL000510 [Lacticaseibacillus camelliae DSM 22697 = JCM 13995]
MTQHFPRAGQFQSRLASGGLFNTSYTLTLADGQRYMLTAGPVNRDLLIPYERHLMPGAVAAYALLQQVHLPCPEVVAQADESSCIRRSYLLTRYIPGKPLNSPDVAPNARDALYRQFGAYMKRMHAITAPCFGRLSDTAAGRGFTEWNTFIQMTMRTALKLLVGHALLDQSDAQQLFARFDEATPLFKNITKPALVHADLWEPNILVSEDDQQLAAVIDADRALFGDPEFDFPSDWLARTSFFSGYGKPLSTDPAAIRRRQFYHLVYLAQDAYVWAVEYADQSEARRCLTELMDISHTLAN